MLGRDADPLGYGGHEDRVSLIMRRAGPTQPLVGHTQFPPHGGSDVTQI